jgi:hypothetical protein
MEKDNKKPGTPDLNEALMMDLMVDGVKKEGLQTPIALRESKVEPAGQKPVPKEKYRAKRATENEYEAIFLKKADSNARDGKTVYIRPDFHEKLSRIIQVIGEDKLTIYAYLDNVLAYHFQEFGEQITKSFNDKYKPIL